MKRSCLIFLPLFLLLLSGCNRRPLEEMSSAVELKVVVNTKNIMNVTCNIYNPLIPRPSVEPDMMRVLFYTPGRPEIAAESYISRTETSPEGTPVMSGKMYVLPGNYELMIYNFDTSATQIRGDQSYATLEAFTDKVRMAVPRATDEEPRPVEDVCFEPDYLMVASVPDQEVDYHDGTLIIETVAHPVVESYFLQVRVEGLEYVLSAKAYFSNMVSSNFIAHNRRSAAPATLQFGLQKSTDKGEADGAPVLCTVFNTFGRPATGSNELTLTFDIQTRGGNKLTRTFDVTHLFETEACKQHRWLLLDEVITVEPESGGSGFDPGVDDWEDENHDLDI